MSDTEQSTEIRNCEDCTQDFEFSVSEQEFYARMEYVKPKRCKQCRKERKDRAAAKSAV